MQTIQIHLLNENEEVIENLIITNQRIIDDISLYNYSISNIVKIITLKIGVEYNEFEKFLLNLKHPIVNSILDNMDTINIIKLKKIVFILQSPFLMYSINKIKVVLSCIDCIE